VTVVEAGEARRLRWEARAEWPLTAAALLFLLAYAWPILDPGLPRPWVTVLRGITWATWALFAVDYLVRLGLSTHRGLFVRRNLFDLLVVILPLLRPLRLLRLITLLTVLNRHAGSSLRGKVVTYAAGGTILVVLVGALAGLDAERGVEDANITNFGDAVWWAIATITTVGYGDHFPVTFAGRAVAGGLMLAGVALLGTITATLASWLVQRVTEQVEAEQTATRRDVEALTAEVRALREELQRQALPPPTWTAKAPT
jgi:voltage-gated potassium channel